MPDVKLCGTAVVTAALVALVILVTITEGGKGLLWISGGLDTGGGSFWGFRRVGDSPDDDNA